MSSLHMVTFMYCLFLGQDKDRFSPGSCFIPGKSKYRVIFIGEPRAAYVPGTNDYKPWVQMEYMDMDMPKDIAQWFRVHFPNHVMDTRPKPTKAEKDKLDVNEEERLLMFEWVSVRFSVDVLSAVVSAHAPHFANSVCCCGV